MSEKEACHYKDLRDFKGKVQKGMTPLHKGCTEQSRVTVPERYLSHLPVLCRLLHYRSLCLYGPV